MRRAWDVGAVRTAEALRLAQVPEGALMQRAAAGLATVCARLLRERGGVSGRHVVLLVGAGNNGGDALWAGARLAGRGARVDAVLASAHPHATGLAALRRAGGRSVAAGDAAAPRLLAAADVVVDGLVGLGGSPGLRAPVDALVAGLPPHVPLVAVDLPSGVDPDTGETPAAHVRATLTVTFGALKPCLLLPPAAGAAGTVELVDIGLGPLLDGAAVAVERLGASDAAALLPVPDAHAHKYTRGVVGVVAGSAGYTGAAVLACAGALRSGAGMVRYLGPDHPAERVRAAWPEVVVGAGRVQAWVLGSGVDLALADARQRETLAAALSGGLPCVVDAGALDLVRARAGGPSRPLLLTPHAGELALLLARLTSGTVERADVEHRPLHHAREAARLTGATVLLKGAVTLVAGPDGRVRSQADAPPWLATAGAGDVLAGIAGTYLASGLDPLDAGSLAALVHGRAASLAAGGGAGRPILARDVGDCVPAAVGDLLAHFRK